MTRDLIADSTEALAMAHQFDGLVMIPNCDKNVPGLLMAAARVNIPTIFVSGGPMLAGHVKGSKTSLSSMFEAVGSYAAEISEEDVCEFEEKACPTCGSCSGMYTANSMNCLTEALGMGLKGNGTIPAVYSARLQLAKHAGMQVMELVRKNIRPRDIMTKEAILNALTVDNGTGMFQQTVCCTFLRSHMRSEWILRLILPIRSARKLRICAILLRQDIHTWKISTRPAEFMR